MLFFVKSIPPIVAIGKFIRDVDPHLNRMRVQNEAN